MYIYAYTLHVCIFQPIVCIHVIIIHIHLLDSFWPGLFLATARILSHQMSHWQCFMWVNINIHVFA